MNNSSETSITAALRQAADLIDQHPNLPQPYLTSAANTVELNWFLHGRSELDEQKAQAAEIVRTIDGTWGKTPNGPLGFTFTQTRGSLKLYMSVDRPAMCDRIVTGVETVTIPAVEAQPEQVVEREVVEWRCQPLLAGADTVSEQVPA